MHKNPAGFTHLSTSELNDDLASKRYVIVDIRDENSYKQNHIPGAFHLTNESMAEFLRQTDIDAPTVVCCYHGNSSQQAAQFLISQDFTDVYSLDGGFSQWLLQHPDKVESL